MLIFMSRFCQPVQKIDHIDNIVLKISRQGALVSHFNETKVVEFSGTSQETRQVRNGILQHCTGPFHTSLCRNIFCTKNPHKVVACLIEILSNSQTKGKVFLFLKYVHRARRPKQTNTFVTFT